MRDDITLLLYCSGDFTISLSRSDKPGRDIFPGVLFEGPCTLIKSLYKTERGGELLRAVK